MNVTSYNADPSIYRPNKEDQRKLLIAIILDPKRFGGSVHIIDSPEYDVARLIYESMNNIPGVDCVNVSCYNKPQKGKKANLPSKETRKLWEQCGIKIYQDDIYSMIEKDLVEHIDLIWYDGTGAWDVSNQGLFQSPQKFFVDLIKNHGPIIKNCRVMLNLHMCRWNTPKLKDQMGMINLHWITPFENNYAFELLNDNSEGKIYNDSGQNMMFLDYRITAKTNKTYCVDPPFFLFDNKKSQKRPIIDLTESVDETDEDNSVDSGSGSEDSFIENDEIADSEDSFEGESDDSETSESDPEDEISEDLSTGNSDLDADVRSIIASTKRRRTRM